LNTGVVTSVLLSVFDGPVSDAGSRSGVDGAAGALLSIVTDSPADSTLALPAASVALAVMLWAPAVSPDVEML
jgi:hypothetical protein